MLIKYKSTVSDFEALSRFFKELDELTPCIFKSITSNNGSEFVTLYEDFNRIFYVYFT